MTAKEWMTFPGVIHIPIGEEPPEPTMPKEDNYGNPLSCTEDGVKYQVRKAYFSNQTYIQAVKLKDRGKKKKSREDIRKDSEEAVRAAREQVRREAEELRERYKERTA